MSRPVSDAEPNMKNMRFAEHTTELVPPAASTSHTASTLVTHGGSSASSQSIPTVLHVRQVRQRMDEQIVELPIPQITREIDAVKLVPRRNKPLTSRLWSPIAIEKQIVEPHSTIYGGQCRRVQKCTPGAIFGTDLRTDRERHRSTS